MNLPLFWSVTGYDFARSIKWARQQTNVVQAQIRKAAGKCDAAKKEKP
jgi:hypothetical protein